LSCELSGWEPHELEGLTLAQYLATVKPSDPQERRLKEEEIPLVRALNGNRVMAVERAFSNRLGVFVPIVVNAAPLIGPGGGVIGVHTALTDLRKFKALEHGLRELYEKHS
jgi:hypothetical protein